MSIRFRGFADIHKKHPEIWNRAVVGIADDRMGEIGQAFVVLRSGMVLGEAEVLTGELPRNACGTGRATRWYDAHGTSVEMTAPVAGMVAEISDDITP